MKNRTLIFVGSMNLGHKPDDGETMKNVILSKALSQYVSTIKYVDVRHRPKRVLYLAYYLWCLLAKRNAKLIFSASSFVTYRLLKVAKLLGWKGEDIYYWVIGGNFGNYVTRNQISSAFYFDLKKIIVEGETMKAQLEAEGFKNVKVLPNIKEINYVPVKLRDNRNITRFVFLSRVIPEKGVDYIVEASKRLLNEGVKNFIVDLYGSITPQYKAMLESNLEDLPNVKYKGFLTLDNHEGYDTLAGYDTMLFPTYWPGEGFPGILIDAFIAGLPVITTDWNLNTSLVHDGSNGIIIPVHDIKALAEKMKRVVCGKVDIDVMSMNSQRESKKYDVKNVITERLMKELEIL